MIQMKSYLGKFLTIDRSDLNRCVEKETGAPIFGSTGSISETVGSEQNCECARHYYEALVQGCKMSITFHGSIEQFQAGYLTYFILWIQRSTGAAFCSCRIRSRSFCWIQELLLLPELLFIQELLF